MTKLDKILNKLPVEVAEQMRSYAKEQLEGVIVASEQAIDQAKTELDGKSEYIAAKQVIKDLSESFRDLKKYQRAKIEFALILLEEKA